MRYHHFHMQEGEHHTLANTYYILCLTTNIISCSQRDEDGFLINIQGGIMRARDEKMRLLAKIHRDSRKMYMLDITITHPVCLMACADEDAWTWHEHFTHINFGSLRSLLKAKGLPGLF
jgi:hypothetical protein